MKATVTFVILGSFTFQKKNKQTDIQAWSLSSIGDTVAMEKYILSYFYPVTCEFMWNRICSLFADALNDDGMERSSI
jgi:hypothetical protein